MRRTQQAWVLHIGILIAGSLYWLAVPHRERWRAQFLNKNRETSVKVPIRYGRLSRSRTYTMVYAPGTPPGRAKVVACKRAMVSLGDIVDEAAALWGAEQSTEVEPAPGERHSAHWGCVALLPNPNSCLPGNLLEEWAHRVSQEGPRGGARNYDTTRYDIKGESAINDRGILQIPWPDRADTDEALDGFDLLLATVTKPVPDPNTHDFVGVAVIAEAWNKKKDASYFHLNRMHGFYTFQDEDIAAQLKV